MALILDESFDAGLPSAIATLKSQSGSPTVNYNATAKAVDLDVAANSQQVWNLTSVPLSVAGEFELDLEMIADHTGTYNHAGVWLSTEAPVASSGLRLAHNSANWDYYSWEGSSAWSGNTKYQVAPQNGMSLSAGERRTIRVAWDMGTSTARHANCRLTVDGQLMIEGWDLWASLRPGVFFYNCAVRVHAVKVWDAVQTAFAVPGAKGLHRTLGVRGCAPPEALDTVGVRNISRKQALGKRDPYFGGAGRITGTVKITPNLPTHRKVRLLHEATGILIAETWSDAITGAYSFTHIDPTQTYTVIAFDYTQAYRAVIADRVVSELMP